MVEGKPDGANIVKAGTLRVDKLPCSDNVRNRITEVKKCLAVHPIEKNRRRAAGACKGRGKDEMLLSRKVCVEPVAWPGTPPYGLPAAVQHTP